MRRRLLILAAVALALLACSKPLPDAEKLETIRGMYEEYSKEFPDVPALTPEQVTDEMVVVDVRTDDEIGVSRIAGAITEAKFRAGRNGLIDRKIVVYCTIGARSGEYAEGLREKGFDAYNLAGSILAWAHAGKPLIDAEGKTTKHLHVYGREWDLAPDGYEAQW